MKFKTFCFILVFLSCTGITENEEGLKFEKLETAKPIETTSTIQTTSTIETTTTTLNPMEVNNRFNEIISEISPAVFIEIGKDEYFNQSFSFIFEENRYDVSYNFETHKVYCGYLDFDVGKKVNFSETNVFFLGYEHSLIDRENFYSTYKCGDNDDFFDYIFKYENACYIYKVVNLVQDNYFQASESQLSIIKEYIKLNPDTIFVKPEKIIYSGGLSSNCERSLFPKTDNSLTLENRIEYIELRGEGNTSEEFQMFNPGAYRISYPVLNEFELCTNELNNLISTFAEERKSRQKYSGEEIELDIEISINIFYSTFSIELIQLTLNNELNVYYGQRLGKPDFFSYERTYILNSACNIISSPDKPNSLYKNNPETDLSILSYLSIFHFPFYGEEIVNYIDPSNVWISYFVENEDKVIFDLSYFNWEDKTNQNFDCNNIIYSYDRENELYHRPTWPWFDPIKFEIPIYEISKIIKLNIDFEKYDSCVEFSSNKYNY